MSIFATVTPKAQPLASGFDFRKSEYIHAIVDESDEIVQVLWFQPGLGWFLDPAAPGDEARQLTPLQARDWVWDNRVPPWQWNAEIKRMFFGEQRPMSEWLPPAFFRKLLGISEKTWQRKLKRGELHYQRLTNQCYRVALDQLPSTYEEQKRLWNLKCAHRAPMKRRRK